MNTINLADLVLHGLHGNPLRGLPGARQRNAWVAGDWGRQDVPAGNGEIGSGEAGLAYGISDRLTVWFALGSTYSRQGLDEGGQATLRGVYISSEIIAALPGTSVHLSAAGFYNQGNAAIARGYLNAGTPTRSNGTTNTFATGLRLRADWLNAVEIADFSLTPHASITGLRSQIGAYAETDGGFPAQWDARSDHGTITRIGIDATHVLNSNWTLLGRIEAAHRFETRSASANGTITGLGAFGFEGIDYTRNWQRVAVGAEARLGKGTVSMMLNASNESNGQALWGYASYRIAF